MIKKIIAGLIVLGLIFGLFVFFGSFYVIGPSERGVKVTLGKLDKEFLPPGLGFKAPFISDIERIPVRQITRGGSMDCFSSDLQHINAEINILYRIPEESVVTIYRDYTGDPFNALIVPRVSEALKEVTALRTAADIVTHREQIKLKALELSKKKIGPILVIEDLVVSNLTLSKELEDAIEQKMVQEQEALKAEFKKKQALIDAETAVVVAKGQAESIMIQGEALKKTPDLIQLKIVEKWNGVSPLVVGAGNGANILMPIDKK